MHYCASFSDQNYYIELTSDLVLVNAKESSQQPFDTVSVRRFSNLLADYDAQTMKWILIAFLEEDEVLGGNSFAEFHDVSKFLWMGYPFLSCELKRSFRVGHLQEFRFLNS